MDLDEPAQGVRPSRTTGWPTVALALAEVAVVVIPIQFGLRMVQNDWIVSMPDLNETMLSVDAARHLDQLVGTWTDLGLYHPGPMHFYWLVPFQAMTDGQPAGLFLGTLVLVAACSGLIVVVVARRTTPLKGAAAAGVLLLAFHQISLEGLSSPWNPTMVIFPVAAGLVCAAAALDSGSLRVAFLGAVCGTFAVQAHMGAMLLGLVIIGASIGGAVRRRRSLGARSRPAIVALIVFTAVVLPWLPAGLDQVNESGNLGAVGRYAVTGEVSPRFVVPGGRGYSKHLRATGVVAHVASMTSLAERGSAGWGGARYIEGLRRNPDKWSTLVLGGLLCVALYGADVRRRWPETSVGFRTWLCRAGLVGCAIQFAAAYRARDEFRYYLISGSTGVGIVLWIAALLTLAPHLQRLVPSRPALVAGGGAVLAALAIVALAPATGVATRRFDFDAPAIQEIERRAPEGSLRMVASDITQVNTQQQLVMGLAHHGRSVRVGGKYAFHFSHREQRGPRHADWSIDVVPADRRAHRSCVLAGVLNSRAVCLRAVD